jgi:hypothetical protein
MKAAEPLECAVCQHDGRDVTVVLVDVIAESSITGRRPEPGELYRAEPRCGSCWAAYRRLLDQRADQFLAERRMPR